MTPSPSAMMRSQRPRAGLLLLLLLFVITLFWKITAIDRYEICLQANNEVIRTWGERRMEGKLRNHVDLVKLLDIVDLEKGIL